MMVAWQFPGPPLVPFVSEGAWMRFRDRVVVVTGGGSGLGRQLSLSFAAEGAAVVVADVDEGAANGVASEISNAGGRALAHHTDVADREAVDAMVRGVQDELRPVGVLVNNAAKATDRDFLELDEGQWESDVSVTLKGAFLCSRAVLPGMAERGSGVIINVASVNALGYYGNEAYSAAKAGLLSLTRSLAVRYGPSGVRANAVVPGTLRTPAWDERLRRDPGVLDRVAAYYPLGRVGEPEDVANAVLFLASDDAAWITGAALPVDGGLLAGNSGMMREIVKEG
jgi:meso-butanediol dehydrogenase / (S,S)-butanediol dehydrogenase / diacetyl reductase